MSGRRGKPEAEPPAPTGYHAGLANADGWWEGSPTVFDAWIAARDHVDTLDGEHALIVEERTARVKGLTGMRKVTEQAYERQAEGGWLLVGVRGPMLMGARP